MEDVVAPGDRGSERKLMEALAPGSRAVKRAFAFGACAIAAAFLGVGEVAAQTRTTPATLADPAFTARDADVNGVRLHYVRGGKGPLVLLVHGWLETWWHWRLVMPALRKAGYTVVAVDMRGYGDSSKPATGYDQETIAEDLDQLIKHLGFKRAHAVIGHDMGAPPAYALAARRPGVVERLGYLEEPVPGITTAPALVFDAPQGGLWWWLFNRVPDMPETLVAGKERELLEYFSRRAWHDPTRAGTEGIDEYLRTFSGREGIAGSVGVYRAVPTSHKQMEAEIARGKLNMPVLALGGSSSNGESVASGAALFASNVQGGVLPNCGHFLAEECPDALLQHFLPFLAKPIAAAAPASVRMDAASRSSGPPPAVESVADAFYAAIERNDFRAVASLYGDDLKLWRSFDQGTQNKADQLVSLAALRARWGMRYRVIERHVDGDRVSQRHELILTEKDGTVGRRLQVAAFLTIRNGQVHMLDEYIDSGDAAWTAEGLKPSRAK